MLVLFESPGGFAIFKLLDETKLHETENLFKEFETPERASKVVKLKHFQKFQDMTEAVNAAASLVEGKMTKNLKKLLKKVVAKDAHEQLAVADAKLGSLIKDKLSMSCVANSSVQELMRCIRSQMDSLISEMPKKEMAAMALGLAHGLSRYKLKFSPDKIDTMIIQAVSLLDDLDKELNNYIMRCKEWYGWHFPELAKVISDNRLLVQTIKLLGLRSNAAEADLSELLSEDVEKKVKELAEVSMGTEISDDDLMNILHLCNEILEMSLYRTQLFDYIKNRMMAVAPNLTVLVGELVGARLISHAGSLINLAKHPASTVQILGAEKALFRALKTKHDTPKYGLIYHAQLISQTNQKMKGKLSRMLAAKSALAVRVDALGDDSSCTLGIEHKAKLEARLKQLEEGGMRRISGTGKTKAKWEKYDNQSEVFQYKAEDDSTLPHQQGQKRKHEFGGDTTESPLHSSKRVKQEESEGDPSSSQMSKKKKKKIKKELEGQEAEEQEEMAGEGSSFQQQKKKKIKKEKEEETPLVLEESMDPETSEKKKKKKKKKKVEEEEDE